MSSPTEYFPSTKTERRSQVQRLCPQVLSAEAVGYRSLDRSVCM